MRGSVLVFLSAFCCVLSAAPAPAQRKWEDTHLGRCKLEKVWSGPNLDEDELWGKVTVVVFWDADDKGSLKALANLVRLERKYKRYGLVAIAAYTGVDANAKTKAVSSAKSKRVTFTVVPAARIFVTGKVVEKVPHAVVFNHAGGTVYNDYPGRAMDKKVLESLKRRPAHPALILVKDYDERNYKDRYKFMLSAVAKIKQNRLAGAWKACDARKDETTKRGDQARALLDGLDRYADRLMERAEKAKSESPKRAVELLTRVSRSYKKAPKGEAAAKMLQEWLSDEKFKVELRAETSFRVIERMAARLPPRPTGGPERQQWERRWSRSFATLERTFKKFEKDHAGAEFVERAKRLVSGIAGGIRSILD